MKKIKSKIKMLLHYTKKIIFLGVGLGLIVVGIVGMVMPIIPGVVPLLIGLSLCSRGSKKFDYNDHISKYLPGYLKKFLRK